MSEPIPKIKVKGKPIKLEELANQAKISQGEIKKVSRRLGFKDGDNPETDAQT